MLLFNRYEGAFPIFWNKAINNSIQYYIHTRPTRNTMIISGPKYSGKSTLLNQIAKNLEDEGRFVVNIDAMEVNTIYDLIKTIRTAITIGLNTVFNVKGTGAFYGINEINDRMNKTMLIKPKFQNPMLQKAFFRFSRALENIVNDKKEFNEMSIKLFFDAFENYETILRPVIIFQNVENIFSIDGIGQKLKEAAIARLVRRDLYQDYVPILVEVKNSINLLEIEPLDSFQIIYMNGLKDANNKYVHTYKLFQFSEFKKILNVFGNHQGTFSRIFEDLRYKIPISTSIASIQKEINDTIHSSNIHKISPQICSNSNKIILTKDEILQIKPLFENGYLSIKNGLYVKFMNKEVRNNLCSLSRK